MHSTIRPSEFPEAVNESCSWYAVYTKHQHEKTITDLLARKNFDVFFPTYSEQRKWKDRTKLISLPLFPCYVFVHMELSRKLELLRTPGVCWLVENYGRACPIPECEIEAVRKMMTFSSQIAPHPYGELKDGSLVRIMGGALAGLQGTLSRVKNRYRVVLSIEVLRKAIAVEIDLSDVALMNSLSGIVPAPLAGLRRIA